MLFRDEARLTDRIKGTSSFASDFAARGPRDSKGRSLRDFDLKTRLFRYPCSYLIYSRAFDSLPDEVKDHIYERLWEDPERPRQPARTTDRSCHRRSRGDSGDSSRDEAGLARLLEAHVPLIPAFPASTNPAHGHTAGSTNLDAKDPREACL